MRCSASTKWLPVATFHRSLDDDEHVTSSLVNGVDRYLDRQDHRHQDDQHQDQMDHHQDDQHQVHRTRHRDDQHPDHQDDQDRLGDQHPDHQGDQRQDQMDDQHQDQMDALVRRYLLDRDQVHLQEFGQCEHQHQGQQDDHPLVDGQHQEPHQGDQEEAELDDYRLEEAELDDQMDPFEVAAEVLAQQAQLPAQAQLLLQEFVEQPEQLQLAALEQV